MLIKSRKILTNDLKMLCSIFKRSKKDLFFSYFSQNKKMDLGPFKIKAQRTQAISKLRLLGLS